MKEFVRMKLIHFIRVILNQKVAYYHLLPVNWQFQKTFLQSIKKKNGLQINSPEAEFI